MRSPSQTIGPFFSLALPWPGGPYVVPEGTPGAIRISGRLLDGRGDPVGDGLIETWQLGPPETRGFGRAPTDGQGRYAIITLKPDRIRAPDGTVYAPHLAVSVFARGVLKRARTRIYFSDEAAANQADPVLAGLGEEARRSLMATQEEGGYRFDIHLQGREETAFFDE